MNKFRKYITYVFSLCVILCAVLCVSSCGEDKETDNKEVVSTGHAYTMKVVNEDGKNVKGVQVRLFDSEGNELTWLPETTNQSGNISFDTTDKDNCYVQVAGVPEGYVFDATIQYTFDENDSVTITLEAGEIVNVLEEYVATIGNTRYAKYSDAIAAANISQKDVTIVLNQDIQVTQDTISNTYGKNITIDGNGHTITTLGDGIPFSITQSEGVITLQNMTIDHNATNVVVRTRKGNNGSEEKQDITLNCIDVQIVADSDVEGNYKWGIFNMASAGKINLNLTRTTAKMAVTTAKGGSNYGIVRACDVIGQKFSFTMVDSTIDAANAEGRAGIVILAKKDVSASIAIENSKIKTKNNYPIRANYQPVTLKGTTLTSQTAQYNTTPIENMGDVASDKASQRHVGVYTVKIGDKSYYSLEHAIATANGTAQDVTITLLSDITISEVTVKNTSGKNITVDGNGYTITTEGGNNAIRVSQESGTVEFKNMKIVHKNTGAVMSSLSTNTVTFTDVEVIANVEINNYCLFNLYSKGDTSILNMTRVNVKLITQTKGKDNYGAIIRTGNATDEDTKTVLIYLTDCNFDASEATKHSGILIMPTTTAYVEMKNTNITTKDCAVIRANGQTFIMENCKINCLLPMKEDYLIEYGANVFKK